MMYFNCDPGEADERFPSCFTGGEMKHREVISLDGDYREPRGEKQLNQGLRKSVLCL